MDGCPNPTQNGGAAKTETEIAKLRMGGGPELSPLAQAGDKHDAAKVLKGFGGAASRKKASAASLRQKRTWTSLTLG